jgi:hypothetical protein
MRNRWRKQCQARKLYSRAEASQHSQTVKAVQGQAFNLNEFNTIFELYNATPPFFAPAAQPTTQKFAVP